METRTEDKDRILIGLIIWESSPVGKRGHLARGFLYKLRANEAGIGGTQLCHLLGKIARLDAEGTTA